MAEQVFTTGINSGFYNSINNDRLYSAEDMTMPYKRIVSDGVFATNTGSASTDLKVNSANDGMNIICKKGIGKFADKWFNNTSDFTITVPSNTALLPRRDSVIVRIDTRTSGRVGSIVYITGTPSASPMPPAIGQTPSVYEFRIANIYVAAGASYIGSDAIVDLRGSSECPWITGIIKQVDTSELFTQWQTAYQNYYNSSTTEFNTWKTNEKNAFETWLSGLQQELTVSMNLTKLESSYTSATEVTTVPINITGFNKATDILEVYINGLKATEGQRYTIASDNASITLTPSITANQKVNFVAFKAVIGSIDASAIALINQISGSVSALNSDSGWINFTLESGATAFNSSLIPAVRKFGNRVNIRGAVKGFTGADYGKTICTLPASFKPAMDHYYTIASNDAETTTSTILIKISASDGTVKLNSIGGMLNTTDMISIATDFITG